ncbi:MAG TPA: helix-turn-helix transcriptional regulator [Chloroflexota bacterium]|jgi:hypothetical protein|nr:helix-turn-helix transcriptional regulator [Chloroflexota bacterium]
MVVAVYPRLGELLQERKLTVAELQRQIESRYALPVDRKTLYRLTYHEPVRRAELDVAAAVAAVLNVGLDDLFEVEANPVTEELLDLTPEEASRMAELLDAQARRQLDGVERAELDGLVDAYGRRLVERALRERAERTARPFDEVRREMDEAVAAADGWLRRLQENPAERRHVVGLAKGRRGRSRTRAGGGA